MSAFSSMPDSRPALVLLPGHLCAPSIWDEQVAGLSDLARGLPLSLLDADSMAGLAASVLARAPERFALAGFSMGGHVAMEIMRQAPHRVERLALVDTRADTDAPERMQVRLDDLQLVRERGIEALIPSLPGRWMLPEHAAREDLRERLAAMVRSVGAEGQRTQQRALMTRIDSLPSLAAITCPTLVFCGREDTANPVWMHEAMHGRIAGSRLRVVERCGHLSLIEQPAALVSAMREWLRW
jgi:pimeloyl-ACP methyl ester carboxylesterase